MSQGDNETIEVLEDGTPFWPGGTLNDERIGTFDPQY
jgi:hypothetical protein